MNRTCRSLSSAAAAALCATTAVVGLTAGSAQAMNYDSTPLTAWAYTDKAQPSTPSPNPSGDFLIGSNGTHTGRAYFTYDITPLKGQVLHRVTFYTTERTVNDCSQVAPIEVWRTKPVTSTTTWQHPPKELELLDQRSYGNGVICPGAYLGVDMIPAVQSALARGEKTITFEVRISAAYEADAQAGRTMTQARMSYAANHAPTVSGLKLKYPDAGCGTLRRHPWAGTSMQAQATVTDADPGDYASLTYAYWPVDHPDQRKETYSGSFDLSGLADGTVVAWTAQGNDYDDLGPWGKTCYFTVDLTAPATTPVVSSKAYPSDAYPGTGGPGVAGTFMLDAAGDPDVTGFDWHLADGGLIQRAAANHPGGHAKISITPRSAGVARLQVAAVDAAGNRGRWVEHRYMVRDTAPMAVIEMNGVGLTSHITLTSRAAEVTEFGYAIDGGPETRLPAVDGKGEGDLVFASVGTRTLVERAYAGKKVIGSVTEQVTVTDAPTIASDDFGWNSSPVAGTAGTFTFHPGTTGVVSYLYSFDSGDEQRIDADADGGAVLSWTPPDGGGYTLTVVSVDASGNRSAAAQQWFFVTSNRPGVYANAYGSHIGDTITVSAWSDLPNATAIVYSFDDGPRQTVDGASVTFDVVPTHAGDNVVTVWAKLADGTLTQPTGYSFHLDTSPQVSTHGPVGDELVMGRPGTITFTAAQAGAVSFRYSINWGADKTVPAGADGTATIDYDAPEDSSYEYLTVASLTADGTASDANGIFLPLVNPRVEVENPWSPDWTDGAGGLGVPGKFGFYAYDLRDQTTTYLWHVNDGPVREIAPDPSAWTTAVPYTPDRNGDNTLYVQRQFTDGSLSPMTTVAFKVGTRPLITSNVYQSDIASGGAGQAGVFRFSGGMPGIVKYDYLFTGADAASVDAAPDGSAEVTFTPPAAGTYSVLVIGYTADGTNTTQATYRFEVAGS